MNGLILLDKPQGFTSFRAVAAIRSIYNKKRVGHTGTLDPMATGVLPILVGRATRLCSFVLESDKRYIAGVRLGVVTDSLDITGNVISQCEPNVSDTQLLDAIKHLTGSYEQIPPMFSAIKKDGVRLYDLARQGIDVERKARMVSIYSIKLIDRNGADFIIEVHCSKGTYIRSLADDLGKYLGCGATLYSLRRIAAANFSIEQCKTLEEIRQNNECCILPAEAAVSHLRTVQVSELQARRFMNGASLSIDRLKFFDDAVDGEIFRVKHNEDFLGLSEFQAEIGEVCIKCVVAE